MFTGIVEEVGKVVKIQQRGENRRITIEAASTPKELRTGDSVAVSGVCLTALDIKPTSFSADLAPETWERTWSRRGFDAAGPRVSCYFFAVCAENAFRGLRRKASPMA